MDGIASRLWPVEQPDDCPTLTSGAFRDVYGKSLGALWREFSAWSKSLSAADPVDSATRLTRLGFSVRTPRVGPDGSVWFRAPAPHGFPGLYRLAAGQRGARADRVALRRIGSQRSRGCRGLRSTRDRSWRRVAERPLLVVGRVAAASAALRDTRGWSIRMFQPTAASWSPCVCSRGPGNSSSWTRNRCWLSRTPVAANLCASSRRSAMRTTSSPRLGFRLTAATLRSNGDDEAGHQRLSSSMPLFEDPRVVATSPTGRNVAPEWSADGTALALRVGSRWRSLRAVRDVVARSGAASRIECCGRHGWRAKSGAGARRPCRLRWVIPPRDSISSRAASPCTATRAGQGRMVASTRLWQRLWGALAMRVDTDGATPSGRVAMRASTITCPWPTLFPHGWLPLIDRRDGRWRLGAVADWLRRARPARHRCRRHLGGQRWRCRRRPRPSIATRLVGVLRLPAMADRTLRLGSRPDVAVQCSDDGGVRCCRSRNASSKWMRASTAPFDASAGPRPSPECFTPSGCPPRRRRWNRMSIARVSERHGPSSPRASTVTRSARKMASALA